MSGATNAPDPACGHPGFCEPGSPECLAQARTQCVWCGELDGSHVTGCRYVGIPQTIRHTPPMHPTMNDLYRMRLGSLGALAAGLAPGIRDVIEEASRAEAELMRDRDMFGWGALRPELINQLAEDAFHQWDRVRGEATLMHRGRPELVDQACERWRHDNPGLTRLLKIAGRL